MLFTVTNIFLNPCDWHCRASHTVSSGEGLTQLIIDITMQSQGKTAAVQLLYPPPHIWKTTKTPCCGYPGQLVHTFTHRGSTKADSRHIKHVCVCGHWEMVAKQSSVDTLVWFYPDTCEDKHEFTWLTLTPCWVNTWANLDKRNLIRHQHSGCAQRVVWSPTNSGSSRFRAVALRFNHTYNARLYYGLTAPNWQHTSPSCSTGNKTNSSDCIRPKKNWWQCFKQE